MLASRLDDRHRGRHQPTGQMAHYEPPPEAYATWADFGHAIGLPQDQFGDQASLTDPKGEGPSIYFVMCGAEGNEFCIA
jgi:hypothetical protein